MSSHITVGTSRKRLSRYVNPRDENDPMFLQFLNEVSERFIDDATYKGNIVNAYFETDTQGNITIPWFMDSIMAACVNGNPVPTYSEWHRFVEVGPGMIQPETQTGYPFYDLGDRFCTVADIPSGDFGKLRVAITSTQDVGKKFRIFGRDVDGNDIIGPDNELGELVTLANPTVLTTLDFYKVTGVIKPKSTGYMTLAWMDGVTPTTLSVYQPCETIPLYHRYQIGTVNGNSVLEGETIAVQGRRRYVEMYSENDRVFPPSYGALKFGILAITAEAAPSDAMRATAANYWVDAFGIASKATKKSKGSSRKMLNFSPRGAGVRPVPNSH